MSYKELADTLMNLKLCVHCGFQFKINKENKAICPKCNKR